MTKTRIAATITQPRLPGQPDGAGPGGPVYGRLFGLFHASAVRHPPPRPVRVCCACCWAWSGTIAAPGAAGSCASLGSVVGAGLGIAGGYAMAAGPALLRRRPGRRYKGAAAGNPRLSPPFGILRFLGLRVALAGLRGARAGSGAPPRHRPQIRQRGSRDDALGENLARALACLLLAGAPTFLPPVFELPLFGYLSIALLLIGAIALMPQLAAVVFRLLQRAWLRTDASSHALVRSLTLSRLANARPGRHRARRRAVEFQPDGGDGHHGVEFPRLRRRLAVADFAGRRTRTIASGGTAGLNPHEQAAISALLGVARVDFQRLRSLSLAPNRPAT